MDLKLSTEQREIQTAVRDLLAEKSSIDYIRTMEADSVGYDAELWDALAEIGIPGLLIGESHGGLDLGWEEVAVVFEEIGRSLAPSPVFETAVLAVGLLSEAPDDVREHWLRSIAAGRAKFAVGWKEFGGSAGKTGIQTTVADVDGSLVLNGLKAAVSYANSVDQIIVLARSSRDTADVDVILVEPDAEGVELVRVDSLGSTPQFNVHLRDVRVNAPARLNAPGGGWALWEETLLRSRIARAAWAIGVADRVLELASDYAREREQFGRPIGGFQGISHPLATIAMNVTSNRLLTQEAAWAVDAGKPWKRLAAFAGERAPEVARLSTKVGHQTFGGIGFTNAIDIQLFSRRAKEQQAQWSDPAGLTDLIVDSVLDGKDQN